METKINVARILKDKPVNTKLYSPLYGDVYLSYISVRNNICVLHHRFILSDFFYNGRYTTYKESEIMLFPSKEMRDWSKFAWKKGDILVNKDTEVHIIFDGFKDDTYKTFHGQYYLWEEEGSIVNFEENEDYMQTSEFYKANKEEAQTYINTIEERLGGKLNRESLEVEKQIEFKDGDIVLVESHMIGINTGSMIAIFRKEKEIDKYKFSPALCESIEHDTYLREASVVLSPSDIKIFRPATDSEKQQLFDALAKEGKSWDAEKKKVVGLKPKCEFKPFDKVLCRNSKDDTWEADFFARLTRKEIDYTQSGKYLCVGDLWMYCIPYNEETAHLLGTTDEWKGGEG